MESKKFPSRMLKKLNPKYTEEYVKIPIDEEREVLRMIEIHMKNAAFSEIYRLIQNGKFSDNPRMIDLWDRAHYAEKQHFSRRPLTPLMRFRIRQRHPPPPSICPDGRKTITLPMKAKMILNSWYELHKSNPFPKRHEKELLVLQTGLSLTQVQTWFANLRRRKLKNIRSQEISNNARNNSFENFSRLNRNSKAESDQTSSCVSEREFAPMDLSATAVLNEASRTSEETVLEESNHVPNATEVSPSPAVGSSIWCSDDAKNSDFLEAETARIGSPGGDSDFRDATLQPSSSWPKTDLPASSTAFHYGAQSVGPPCTTSCAFRINYLDSLKSYLDESIFSSDDIISSSIRECPIDLRLPTVKSRRSVD